MHRLHVMLLLLVTVERHTAMTTIGNVMALSDMQFQFGRILEDFIAMMADEFVVGVGSHVDVVDVVDEAVEGRVDGGALRALERRVVDGRFHLRLVGDDQMPFVHSCCWQSKRNLAVLAENIQRLGRRM